MAVAPHAVAQTGGASAANFDPVHALSHKGKDVPIGVVEFTGDNGDPSVNANRAAVNAAHNMGTRLRAEWDFIARFPPQRPLNNSARPGIDHTTLVSNVAAGAHATRPGVAPEALVYVAELDQSFSTPNPTNDAGWQGDDIAIWQPTWHSFRAIIDWMYRPFDSAVADSAFLKHPSIGLFNNSWGAKEEVNRNGAGRFARFVDYFTTSRDVLFVHAAGNHAGQQTPDGAPERINWPADSFNGLTVCSADATFRVRRPSGQYWLAADDGTASDRRGKPDLIAPGTNIGDGTLTDSGTSFAAPQVTGAAAVLVQSTGLTLGTSGSSNHLAIKAALLNSARKRNISGANAANGICQDDAGTAAQASDQNYLNANNTLRAGASGTANAPTQDWTPSEWSFANGLFDTVHPLDDEQGTGMLDVHRAFIQSSTRQPAGAVFPIALSQSTLSSTTRSRDYAIDKNILAGKFLTATLVWDRIIKEKQFGGAEGNGVVDSGDVYVAEADSLPDLDLRVLFNGQSIATSRSLDNVEHLHFPLPENAQPGQLVIRVEAPGAAPIAVTPYAVAWWVEAQAPAGLPGPSGVALLLVAFSMAIAGAMAVAGRTRSTNKVDSRSRPSV